MPVIPECTAPGALTQTHPKRHLKVCPEMPVKEHGAHAYVANDASFDTGPPAPLRGLLKNSRLLGGKTLTRKQGDRITARTGTSVSRDPELGNARRLPEKGTT